MRFIIHAAYTKKYININVIKKKKKMKSLKNIYFTSAIFVSPLFHLAFANRSQFAHLNIVIGVAGSRALCLSVCFVLLIFFSLFRQLIF